MSSMKGGSDCMLMSIHQRKDGILGIEGLLFFLSISNSISLRECKSDIDVFGL
ncbi:hypothetical protein C7212DRAFT_337363 [Tuber magnatum]|uniref:Uncharacterized protein n=1 Tax=Tuber magnatum TaxID=42249 RepID=A0A317SFJ5_9PEZI|nr:hypothetical protein C7212DRAFT_337363 [Tuber magnatum]